MHQNKLDRIKKEGTKVVKPKEVEKDPVELSDKIRQVKQQTNQFKQIERNQEINRENQILLSKLVEISAGKWSSVPAGGQIKKKKKKKAAVDTSGPKKSLNYGQR